MTNENQPLISIIVIIYNMEREAPRTLYSLSKNYQLNITEEDYEVIVIDNGSDRRFEPEHIKGFGGNFTLYNLPDPKPSPANAINYGVEKAKGEFVGIMIDGARIASPGILSKAKLCCKSFISPIIQTLGMHIGHEIQTKSVLNGYCQSTEDKLLEKIKWKNNGYRLFNISSLAGSSNNGYFLPMSESNLLFLSKELFYFAKGFNEKFDMPGGGIVNHDFLNKLMAIDDTTPIMLLGEATFHQFHNGIITNKPHTDTGKLFKEYSEQYKHITNKDYVPNTRDNYLFGDIKKSTIRWMRKSCQIMHEKNTKN